ncbi:hypothetical protein [Carboxylicivirga sp. M1479]|uniref:hypothetical protein n=1 Tax=Carboxylicivirga sp. M1479 TaxID=2594476 RepID=UPI001177923C|nr:hypothetical protein [Carboxylicivirga sp. M1479]TRX66577.1 hypothetical protein FNN09_13005 [Carboxylicivirga sp. M1479]
MNGQDNFAHTQTNIHAVSVQFFNTIGYSDFEASFWLTAFDDARHSFNLRLSHERFESQYFGIGLGYGYDLRLKNHSFQPYFTYNHDIETWENGALVNGLYYTYGGRFDFAIGTTTNFNRQGYANNSYWIDAYYNIKALGGIQLGFEYCFMSDSNEKYYGLIFQKTLWKNK